MRPSSCCGKSFLCALSLMASLGGTATAGGGIGSSSSSSSFNDEPMEARRGWKACRVPPDPGLGCNEGSFKVPTMPTTALLVLLENQQIPFHNNKHVSTKDIYFGTNLSLLPDISQVGRDYYTLLYQIYIPHLFSHEGAAGRPQRLTLRIEGINYRATAFLDGKAISQVGSSSVDDDDASATTDGMFRRHHYNVTAGSRFNILVEPPLHPGNPDGGQGGNHDLAKDGATAQYMLGWDWCQAMPDRATGFYGSITLTAARGPVALLDATVQTLSLECNSETGVCSGVNLRFLVHVECASINDYDCASSACGTVKITSDWGESWKMVYDSLENPDLMSGEIVVQHPEHVRLWWPHGIGKGDFPYLHRFKFSVVHLGEQSHSTEVKVGIRTLETHLDEKLQGQAFKINGKRIYLVGGNWISTDQALRFSASKDRYCNELALHKQAGLNLIRVWAGGTAERERFYECANELGLLVYQEFWMTGDNNGRWAGNYSWPLDYETYAANIRDTVRRLRSHPSLLFYGGCNECLAPRDNPWFPSPSRKIDDSIRSILDQLDPGRFYIASSMGGQNIADTFEDPILWANRSYSLAFADGPYGMQLPGAFFERNPGLRFKNISIGFQPEIGSASAPTYRGLLRIMTQTDADKGVPIPNGEAGPTWQYHKYEDWSTNGTYDHVYTYLGHNRTVNASEWCAAAQLAAHEQYQNLFGGYISHIFQYTTAVIMWKTQSPWPALRGFLYDWSLESTGTLRGVQAALGKSVSIVLDTSTFSLRLVNRLVQPLLAKDDMRVSYAWISLSGSILVQKTMPLGSYHEVIAPMSAVFLGEIPLEWPDSCSSVCFLRLQVLSPTMERDNASWHWLTDPALGKEPDYMALGEMRSRQLGQATVSAETCIINESNVSVWVTLRVPESATEVLFYPTFAFFSPYDEQPILPLFDALETQIVLLPGETQSRSISSSSSLISRDGLIRMETSSWNVPTLVTMVKCKSSTIASSDTFES